MTGQQLEVALHRLNLTPAQFASLIEMTPRQVRRWRRDEVKIPKAVAMAVALLLQQGRVVATSAQNVDRGT